MKTCLTILVAALFCGTAGHGRGQETPLRPAGPYLGQKPPGLYPELFAPGVVSTGHFEHSSPVFSPDGRELYWSVHYEDGAPHSRPVVFMKQEGNGWTAPALASFVKNEFRYENPFFSPDGRRLYFSASPATGSIKDSDLWYAERTASGWSEQIILSSPPNSTGLDAQPSVSRSGNLYFISFLDQSKYGYGLFFSSFDGRNYSIPVRMEPQFNRLAADWTPYIAPDESYLIFCSFREGGSGSGDLYISFRNPDGSRGEAINMGDRINTGANERFPNVTPDGKYLFFNSTRTIPGAREDGPGNGKGDVYWISAGIIEELRRKGAK